MMRHRRMLLVSTIVLLGTLAVVLAGTAEAAMVGPIEFLSTSELTDNFRNNSPNGLFFARSGGPGSGGAAGRVSMTSNDNNGVCWYDTTPDDTWGPDNTFKNCTISVDVAFTDEVFTSTETPGWQDWGIMFNVDANRETTATDPDCLILYIRNASHIGETDEIVLSRGTGRTGDLGTIIMSQTLTGDVVQQTPAATPQYLNVTLDILNSPDNSKLSFNATVTDPATSTVLATLSGTDMDYATTLLGAASEGEIGIIAHNDYDRSDLVASKNSVKWDRFAVVPEPGTGVLGLIGLLGLLGVRRRRV